MVWTGLPWDGRTHLYIFERGTVDAVRYRDEVLEPYGHVFMCAFGPDFILIDDSARRDRPHLVDEILYSEDIHPMHWSVRSPDIPIEQ
ncbi:transposable element Tc1 transposase [Trichonephila clavipes]|nr:transposable element Tc1 transposase [Trichonephila clavipes]